MFCLLTGIASAQGTSALLRDSTGAVTQSFSIPSGKTFTVSSGGTLVMASGSTLTLVAGSVAYSKLTLTNSIVNADVSSTAGIVDTKLATIATAGKVSNSATTGTAANTASTLVLRDGSGNFSAGTVTAALTGNASTATALATGRTIGGVSFDGTANITVATATGGFTVSGGNLALGTNSLTLTGSIASTGSRVTKGWFTDLESTNAIVGSITGNAATVTTNANLTGDVTSSGNATTLATVNTVTPGSFGSATATPVITVNGKGLTTASSSVTITPAVGSITGLGTGVATWLATPSSSNLAAAVTGETGTGALVFGTDATLGGTVTMSGASSVLVPTPTLTNQAATKGYADLVAASQSLNEYLSASADAIGGIYKVMDISLASASTVVSASISSSTTTNIFNWITPDGLPGLTKLNPGPYAIRAHLQVSAVSRSTTVYAELWKRASIGLGGAEVLIATSDTTSALTTSDAAYVMVVALGSATTLLATDRLLIKVYAVTTGGSGSETVTMTVGPDSNPSLSFATPSSSLADLFVPYSGATRDAVINGNHRFGIYTTSGGYLYAEALGTHPTLRLIDDTNSVTCSLGLHYSAEGEEGRFEINFGGIGFGLPALKANHTTNVVTLATSSELTSSPSAGNNSTKLPTTAWVNGQLYGLISGCILTNDAGDATNDIDIAAGQCTDSLNTTTIIVAAIAKRTDAVWALGGTAGSANGGVDEFSSAINGTYHCYAIRRSDTGVVDVLFSLANDYSATATMTVASPCVVTWSTTGVTVGQQIKFTTTGALPTGVTASTTYYIGGISGSTFNLYDTLAHAIAGGSTGRVITTGSQSGTHTASSVPTMPTSYDARRRIGSVIRSGATILGFVQDGDLFSLNTPIADYNSTITNTATLITLTVPVGIRIRAVTGIQHFKTATALGTLVSDPSTTDTAAVSTGPATLYGPSASDGAASTQTTTMTNRAAAWRARSSTTAVTFRVTTQGWIDTRGKDGQ